MTPKHAGQIADLLNKRNKLVIFYDSQRVLQSAGNYIFETSMTGDVIACVELKKIQWYQFEIDHVSVAEDFTRKGISEKLLGKSEKKAIAGNGRILQCTIRMDNNGSRSLFQKCGFREVSSFYYPESGNNVGVWQKVISPPS